MSNAAGDRVILYARVSTEEQASKDHHSIAAQINEMHEFAQKKGWEIQGEFIDEGVSGSRRDRPQLDAALDMVRNRGCDVLLVHELSRLSRSVYDTLDIFEILGKANVGFASVKDPDFNFADPTKRFFLIILAAINQYYLDLLKMHTSKSKRERARQGLYNASITPYGYRHTGDPKTPPAIMEEESKAVRLAYEEYATGRYSHKEIADLLNRAGYRTRPNKQHPGSHRFTKDTVAEMLRNPFYMGKILYHKHGPQEKELYDGLHEPIVSPELWERCQRVRESKRVASRAVQPAYRVYLLSNLAVCDVCGRKLRSQGSLKNTYYREMSYERGYTDCPHERIGTPTGPVDRQIHAIIQSLQLPEEWLAELSGQIGDDEELTEIRRQRERLEAERRRLKEMKIAGEFDEDADLYNQRMAAIRRELDTLPTYDQIETLSAAAQTIQNLPQVWPNAEPADQRDLLRLMLRQVEVDVPNGRVVSVSPLATFIPIFRLSPLLAEREFGVFVPTWPAEKPLEEDGKAVIPVPQIPTLAEWPDRPAAPPFLAANPLLPNAGARIAPGISRALALCKESGLEPEIVLQASHASHGPLPCDLRKWPQAAGDIQPIDSILARPDESVDVLVTCFWLWNNASSPAPADADRLLAEVGRVLSPGGVWYFQDLLPLDMPAHWLYHALPPAREWAKAHTWRLHTLYNRLLAAHLAPLLKRHLFYQPVLPEAAAAALQHSSALLQLASIDVYTQFKSSYLQSVDRIHPLSAELALVEGWARKPTP